MEAGLCEQLDRLKSASDRLDRAGGVPSLSRPDRFTEASSAFSQALAAFSAIVSEIEATTPQGR